MKIRCPMCKTKYEGSRCPKCGRITQPEIVQKEIMRRAWLIMAGVILGIIGFTLLMYAGIFHVAMDMIDKALGGLV